MEQEACVDPQLSAGALVEVVGLDELDGLRGEVSSVAADGGVYVELKLPYGEMLLEAANVRVVGERFGDWEKVMSSSTSPGDFYWFNWETGESSWEEPEEVTRSLGASVIPPVHHPTSFGGAPSAAAASRKRAFPYDASTHSHYQAQHDDSDANSGSDGSSAAAPSSSSDAAAAAAAAAAAKEAKARELEQLRVRLGSLEQKKRKLEDSRSQQQVAEFAAQSMDSMQDVRDAINQRLVCIGRRCPFLFVPLSRFDIFVTTYYYRQFAHLQQETLVKESGDSKSTLVVLSECIAPEAD